MKQSGRHASNRAFSQRFFWGGPNTGIALGVVWRGAACSVRLLARGPNTNIVVGVVWRGAGQSKKAVGGHLGANL